MILAGAAGAPGKTAIVDYATGAAREVSYDGLLAGASRVARQLDSLSLPAGIRIVLAGGNSPEWAAAALGIHLAGFTIVPLDPELSTAELDNILTFLEPSAAVCENFLTELLKKHTEKLIDLGALDLRSGPETFDPQALPENQPLSIVFTSGSTSQPKGVMLSENNFLHNVEVLLGTKGLFTSRDRLLNLLPLHHVYAFTATLLTPLCAGATVVYPRSLKSGDIAAAAEEQRITVMAVVPQVLQSMHKRIFSTVREKPLLQRILFRLLLKLSSLGIERGFRPGRYLLRSVRRSLPQLRFFASGGARLDAGLHRELAALGFRVLEAYGLSETAPIVTLNSLRRPVFGSVGRPAPGVEIKLQRTDNALADPEVLVRGPNVMAGYWRLPEETDKAFLEGWFRTGDLGRLDRRGNLYLSGRSKEVLVMPSGKNIYPEELEKIYSQSSLIEEVCICLLAGERGEQLTAVVVPSREALRRRKLTRIYDELKFDIENLTVNLPSYQRVTRILVSEEPFPRTRLGKLKRYEIVERLERGKAAAPPVSEAAGEEPAESADELLAFVKRNLELKTVPTGKENLELDLGLDSLTKLDFLSAFESEFGISLGDEQAGGVLTVDDLRPYIRPRAESRPGGGISVRGEKAPLPPLEDIVEVEDSLWGLFLRFSVRLKLSLITRLFFPTRVSGLENLPARGAYIIAPNHRSYIDGLLIHAVVPWPVSRRLFSMATAGIFDRFPFAQLAYRARIIKTGTLETTAQSLVYAEQLLKKGFPLILFPEGKRSIDGRVDEPKPGAARLALAAGVPLVPVYLSGTEKLLSRMHPGLSLGPLQAEILPPIPPVGGEEQMLTSWTGCLREKERPHAS